MNRSAILRLHHAFCTHSKVRRFTWVMDPARCRLRVKSINHIPETTWCSLIPQWSEHHLLIVLIRKVTKKSSNDNESMQQCNDSKHGRKHHGKDERKFNSLSWKYQGENFSGNVSAVHRIDGKKIKDSPKDRNGICIIEEKQEQHRSKPVIFRNR